MSQYDAKPYLSKLKLDTVLSVFAHTWFKGNSSGRQLSNHARFCLGGTSLRFTPKTPTNVLLANGKVFRNQISRRFTEYISNV